MFILNVDIWGGLMQSNRWEETILVCAIIDTDLLLEGISTEEKINVLFQFLMQHGSYYNILPEDIETDDFDELWSLWLEIRNTFYAAKVTYEGKDNLFYVV